jgi:hypothetical protein
MLNRFPVALSLGQYLRAMLWLIIATGGASLRSVSVNARTSTNPMRMAAKYPASMRRMSALTGWPGGCSGRPSMADAAKPSTHTSI